jgi:hypothetical protein
LFKNLNIKIYKSIILPVVLYSCQSQCLTLREEHTLRELENRVLKKIFGPKEDELAGGWRKLYNEELHKLYFSSNIIRMIKSRRMRWTGHVAHMRDKSNEYIVLVGKLKGKRPLGHKRWWKGNIKMDFKEI